MKQSPQKSQSKLEKTTLLLQYFCNLKNFFRLHFSTIQAKIHIQSHSIFIYLFFFHAHMALLLCFFSQETEEATLLTTVTALMEKERRCKKVACIERNNDNSVPFKSFHEAPAWILYTVQVTKKSLDVS